MNNRAMKYVGGLAVVAALTLGVAACSSDSKSSSDKSSSTTAASKAENIVQVASGNADFSTLVSALKTAGLVDTLSGNGPFTVFAPTNAAFAALPAGTLASLTPEQLKSVLTYHVVAGDIMAKDVKAGKVKTANGAEFTINVKDGKVTITDAKGNTVNVVKTDVDASNGVIHVIDGVLLP